MTAWHLYISWFPAVVKNIWLFLFRVGLGKPSSSLSLRSPSSSSLSLRRPSCYDKKTAWHSLPVSCNTILCTKLERHIECTRVVRFWFSCMWQLKSIIVWCFTWFQNRENDFLMPISGHFVSLPKEQGNIERFRTSIVLVVKDYSRTIFQSSLTCTFYC